MVETSLKSPPGLALKDNMLSVMATGITADSYYLVNSLPAGYVRDGSVDYTSYVQAAVTKYSNIVFPGFPILVNNTGITVGSNKTISFEEGSEIRLKGTDQGGYSIFRIYGASKVALYNPVIIGDRDSHIGTTGEWGMGIGIYGSSDISIYNAKISKCWGDGIYIGQQNNQIDCKNIVIKDAYLYKNRRDGITVIGVDGLLMENIYAGYTDGTLPMTGINFEPNNAFSEIKNVRIINPVTENNGKNGIQFSISNMMGSTDKFIDVSIVNHKDIGSPRFPFKISCAPAELTGKIYGQIDIVNPDWHKTALETNLYLWLGTSLTNLKTTVSSPEIMNVAGAILPWTDTYNLIMKAATGGDITVTQGETVPVVEPGPVVVPEPDPVVVPEPDPVVVPEPDPVVVPEPDPVVVPAPDPIIVTPPILTPEPIPTPTPIPAPSFFAVNAGGNSFKASNGITYLADNGFSGGTVGKSSKAIDKTTDDVLYQSARYGNFTYSIPLASGTYTITFRLAETVIKGAGKRQFDILAGNNLLVSNLDIFKQAGSNTAYDVVKTVVVTDGMLNLRFNTDVNGAAVSAFHVVKK
ncbi:hypothetical protein GZH53_08640 [Flavihumibacter sp. R14]|nr:hypothetical protein [Flavihumibacter soli]